MSLSDWDEAWSPTKIRFSIGALVFPKKYYCKDSREIYETRYFNKLGEARNYALAMEMFVGGRKNRIFR